MLSLDSLVRLERARRTSGAMPSRLALPEDMAAPLGCDAVTVPASYGPLLLSRLPRVGCVYADRAAWWWIVPSDSDVALSWPAPTRYAKEALVPEASDGPGLIHRPDDTVPYTPPIPLYLAVCQVTGTAPAWSRPLSA
ncbi:hypothetical protein [Streptomyces gibsoniae]|uniref:Uncharacterized protein n=1 Tax=Streptomyces gibsoniae TaxID=3075529 RepID=A0ABU2TXB0_9ACTN|nr:hypothetical protein [Streptomyces sp. DSM 41699]MDT0465606.1 hypothetical protein [Streptomyces sp. DSM 41699]